MVKDVRVVTQMSVDIVSGGVSVAHAVVGATVVTAGGYKGERERESN